jgi:hypothetical protein
MTVTAEQIMVLAGRVLQDESATRWTLPELCDWINEAVKAIVLAKPSATSQTVTMTLQVGTYQQLPDQYLSLLRLVRNISAVGPPRVGGRVIRVTDSDALDAANPDWHNPRCVKYAPEVRQFVFDDDDPLVYYVYPGNDGTGVVEGVVSILPAPVVATGDVALIGSYNVDVGLKDMYLPPLLDYVLYRAMSKDDTAANPAGSQVHFQAFTFALGVEDKVATTTNPNAKPRGPS